MDTIKRTYLLLLLAFYAVQLYCSPYSDTLNNKKIYHSVSFNFNSLINKSQHYKNTYYSPAADGYNQDVTIYPKPNIAFGIGYSVNKNLNCFNKKLHIGLVNELNLYKEVFTKKGYENDISYSSGNIEQNSNYLVYSLNLEGYRIKFSTLYHVDMCTGIGVYCPFFTFGEKSYSGNTYNRTTKWAYADATLHLYCPVKLMIVRKIKDKALGLGVKTFLTDSYRLLNENANPDMPDYSGSNIHAIGFNGISSYSLNTHNDPSKTVIIQFSVNLVL